MDENTASSTAKKLEKFFNTLGPEEQSNISELVRESLLSASARYMQDPNKSTIPPFVEGMTGQNAPNLIKSLNFPGQLVAYSIPGCNRSALEELSKSTQNQ
jgi:hypothetical protein